MAESMDTYKNPLKLPLEKLYLKIRKLNGKDIEVKAIDKFWVKQLYYPSYSQMPSEKTDDNVSKWLNRADNYIKSLKFLLSLPYHKFWSYIYYEPQIPALLKSFLSNTGACYMSEPDPEFLDQFNKIYRLVFSIFKRILTFKESEDKLISLEITAGVLYDNKYITNHILWDLVRIFGHSNQETLSEMMNIVYLILPNLENDLEVSLSCFNNIFTAVANAAYESESVTENQMDNVTGLLYDTAFSINMYLRLYPPFRRICITEKFYSKIIHTYDVELPQLYATMHQILINEEHHTFGRVDKTRVEFLEVVHQLCSYCMDEILKNQDNIKEQKKWIETYFEIIESTLSLPIFLVDFDSVYPISQDIDMLLVICPNVEQLTSANINRVLAETRNTRNNITTTEKVNIPEVTENGYDEACLPDDVMLESKISELKELFPDLGDGFIERCLTLYDMDSQKVTMAILENRLPMELGRLDRALPRIPPEQDSDVDVQQCNATATVHVGKKPSEYKDLIDMLDDKLHVQEQKTRFRSYSLLPEEETMYDDDYDDSYNEPSFAVMDRDNDDMENFMRKRNRWHRPTDAELSDHEEEDGGGNVEEPEQPSTQTKGAQSTSKNAFCDDPALIRARREANYQQRQPHKSRDVVGKPKGQGQEKNVVHNRDTKTTHKSARANHNRRAGAQWKRNRGMVPS